MIPTLVHSTSFISEGVSIGEGSIICARTTVATGAKIGKYCITTRGSIIPRKTILPDWGYYDFEN